MKTYRSIAIEDLCRRADARRPDDGTIAALAESIADVGLLNPLTVRPIENGRFEIIAGSHRYAACDVLDHREIACEIVEHDDLHAELAMIDENLCRAELSATDRAKQTARRKAIYEELHPSTRNGANQHTRVGQAVQPNFAEATAAATGRDDRSVRRDAERGEKVIAEAMDMIRGTKLDKGSYLDAVKRVPASDQVEKVRHDLAARPERGQHRIPVAPVTNEIARPPSGDAFTRFIQLADDIEALGVGVIISASGRQRAVLGQRASGLADMMSDIMEGLDNA